MSAGDIVLWGQSLTEHRVLCRIAGCATRNLVQNTDVCELGYTKLSMSICKVFWLTFEISLACHLRIALASSSARKPIHTLALTRALTLALALSSPAIGDFISAGVRLSLGYLSAESKEENLSVILCRFFLSKNTTSNDRLSLK